MDIKLYKSIKEISASLWSDLEDPHFPFLTHSFLLALESSKVVGMESGWIPHYLTIWEGPQLQGALCLYKKKNSYGEFIFDWEWAHAYQHHGLAYYPKLISAVPFTPATGAKLLLNPNVSETQKISQLLVKAALKEMEQLSCSSLHFLFIPEEEISAFESQNFLIRHSYQFHWENQRF